MVYKILFLVAFEKENYEIANLLFKHGNPDINFLNILKSIIFLIELNSYDLNCILDFYISIMFYLNHFNDVYCIKNLYEIMIFYFNEILFHFLIRFLK